MRAGLIVTGVLGFGVALTFGAALLAATMFPNGTSVNLPYGGQARGGEIQLPGRGWVVAPDVPTGNTWGPGGIDIPDQGPMLPGAGSLWRGGAIIEGDLAGPVGP